MFIMRTVLMLVPAAIAVAAGCLGFLLTAGAVNSRAEDEYWQQFWSDTPTTEGSPVARSSDTMTFPERRNLREAA